ncbi:hypothetical protein [Synechococcus sp. RSCCF101]|uniref:hypothetical protein n=1 Tax=Synechococcus sp. RSCCF101 TaxID=2511069 RepID=UPI001784D29F|nr:hypothetical protein [Synechococcus sp. RSCCF101]
MDPSSDRSRQQAIQRMEEELDGAVKQAIDRHEFKMSLIGVITLLAFAGVLGAAVLAP